MTPTPLKRVAMFFNHRSPHTTGHYFVKILRQSAQVDLFLPDEAKSLRAGSHDLYLRIDDSTHHVFPDWLHPSALWIIDTHLTYGADLIMAKGFDFVFAANKSGAARLRKDGIASAAWLPLAYDPDTHGPRPLAKVYPIAFIGGDGWGRRRRLLERLRDRFPDSFISMAPHTEIGLIYSQAKIVFNCAIKDDLNMRVFEGLGSGSCLVTNADTDGLADLFQDGKHVACYSGERDAVRVLEELLADEARREAIAAAGHAEAVARHSYAHRLETILSAVRAGTGATLSGRGLKPGPWDEKRIRMLERWYYVDSHLQMMLP